MDIKCGYFKTQTSGMSGQMSAAKVILGFVPDVLEIRCLNDESGLRSYWWAKSIHDAAGVGQYGIGEFNDGVVETDAGYGNSERRSAIVAEIDGISALDETYAGALIESPIAGVGKKPKKIATWESALVVYNTRDKGQIGDIVRPKRGPASTFGHIPFVYEAISNSAADSQTDGTNEPKWPSVVGQSVVDDSLIWMTRDAEYVQGGGKGFIMGHSMLTENSLSTTSWMFKAIRADVNRDIGVAPNVGELYLGKV